ncbi:MAG TPA: hypothetical protein VGI84_12065 [Pseudonocardiaceae bacterium]
MIDNLVNTEDEATDQHAQDDHQPDSVILLPGDMPFSYQEGEAAALAAVLAGILATVAADTGARLAVVAPERSSRLARPRPLRMVPVQGPRGTWAMVLLLS